MPRLAPIRPSCHLRGALCVLAGLLAFADAAQATPLTLTGNYLQVGVSDYGTFGSDGGTEPGLLHDPTGMQNFAPGGTPNDYLTPGTPHDGFALHSTQTGLLNNDNDGISDFGRASPTLLTGAAANGYQNAASWTSTVGTSLTVTNSYYFNNGDEQIKVVTIITALTNLSNVAFARSEDPDPDVNRFGTYDTINTRGDTRTAPKDLASAAGANTGLTIGILNLSGDTYAHNTEISGSCCSTSDPYEILANTDTLAFPNTNSGDFGLQLAYGLGDLAAGQSITLTYAYVFGTHQGTVSEPTSGGGGTGLAINTTDGDVAASIFSLGSAAATASTVTFDGGTLRFVGGSFANNIITAAVTINATNGAVDTNGVSGGFSGVVSGAGGLTVSGGGVLSLSAANTYAGGTTINASTVLIGAPSALGTGAVTFNGGTLQAGIDGLIVANAAILAGNGTIDTRNFGLIYSGAISGPGGLTKVGLGTLLLSNINPYAGDTALREGTLAVGNSRALGSGTLHMAGGTTLLFAADGLVLPNAITFDTAVDPVIDTQGFSATASGPISGGGDLTKMGTGTLDLTGTGTYTGTTTVAAGTLLIDGSITSVATVQSGATLGGSGTVGGIVAQSGAVVAPGSAANPYGTFSVKGDVTLGGGSTFVATVDADGRNSRLAATGAATITGANIVVLATPGTFKATTTYTLLTAAGGVNGTFANFTADSALAYLYPTLLYGANDVTLGFRRNPVIFAAPAATLNQFRVAEAIAAAPVPTIFDAILTQTDAGARAAFQSLSGVSHASTTSAIRQTARVVGGLIVDRLWDIGGSGLDARQLLDKLAPDSLPALVRCYGPLPDATGATSRASAIEGYTAWGQGFGDFGTVGAGPNAGSLTHSLGGFVLGVDTPLSGALGDAWRVGVAGGYTNDTFHTNGASGTVEGIFGSLYGGARYGNVDIRLGVTGSANNTDSRRTVAFPGFFETERSTNGGYAIQGFGEVGYRYALNRFVVEPVAGLSVVHVHQDGFSENGGAAALIGAAQDTDVETTTLGVRGEVAPFSGLPLVARGFVGWQHAFGDITPASILAFKSVPANAFAVTGTPIDRNAVAAEVALDWRASSAVTLGISYNGQYGANAQDSAVKGRIEYRF